MLQSIREDGECPLDEDAHKAYWQEEGDIDMKDHRQKKMMHGHWRCSVGACTWLNHPGTTRCASCQGAQVIGHDPKKNKPACRFFGSWQWCKHGRKCFHRHMEREPGQEPHDLRKKRREEKRAQQEKQALEELSLIHI